MLTYNLAAIEAENAALRARVAELEAMVDSLRRYIHTLNHNANVMTLRALDAERMLAMHPETGEVRDETTQQAGGQGDDGHGTEDNQDR